MQVNKAFEVFAKDIILRSSSHVECDYESGLSFITYTISAKPRFFR